MKTLLSSLLLTSLLSAYELEVNITDILNEKGEVFVGLYNKSESFSVVEKTYKQKQLKASKEKIACTFKNLNDGVYAVAIFHDENSNKELDKNFLGMPTEGYAFSNNVRPTFRGANFEESQVNLKSDKSIVIKMAY